MKKIICFALATGLILSSGFSKVKTKFDQANAVKDTGSVEIKDVASTDVTKVMGTGWNLGNTLEATGGKGLRAENSWGAVTTTKEIIDGVAAAGFKTIRIPVSWAKHMDENYTIDPEWMNRVKTVVDWAIEDGMYVILNCHHDNFGSAEGLTAGKGYYPTKKNYKISEAFFANMWAQIALAFNNGYDEYLIFETMNEPRLIGTKIEWSFAAGDSRHAEAQDMINKLNQVTVDVVRASGGNNAKRLIMMPGYAATPAAVLSEAFVLPTDTVENKLIVSVHMYTPFIFAGQSPGTKKFSVQFERENASTFRKLNQKFVQNGTAVIIGEYGAVNKENSEERVKWFTSFIRDSQAQGLPAVLWDNFKWKINPDKVDYSEKFGFYDRRNIKWVFPEINEAIMSNVVNK